mgnify:CR=1 FL=1
MIIQRKTTFIYVCAIGGYIENNKNSGNQLLGTGTFIAKDGRFYILTAEHVINNAIKAEYIILCDSNMTPQKVDLTQLNINYSWKIHSVADMAVMEIDSLANQWILSRAIPYDHCEVSMFGLDRDTEVTTVGFPCGLGIKNVFAPLTFRSFPASEVLQLNRIDKKGIITDVFLLEDPSIGGYSGGPVFDLAYKVDYNMTQTKDKTRLYGIMHGYIGYSVSGGHMSFVTPISYLKQLI